MKLFFDAHEPTPYHVVGKCPGSSWPGRSLSESWQDFSVLLKNLAIKYKVRTHAFVLMRNHFHWIGAGGSEDLSSHFPDIKIKSIELAHPLAYRQAYAYVYRNPVAAGLVGRAEDYPYSTLPYVLGRTPYKLVFPCLDQMNLIYDPARTLRFINGSDDRFDLHG